MKHSKEFQLAIELANEFGSTSKIGEPFECGTTDSGGFPKVKSEYVNPMFPGQTDDDEREVVYNSPVQCPDELNPY